MTDLDAHAYVLQIAREEAKTYLEAKNYWEARADVAEAALARLVGACEALRTRTDARDYLPAEYDAVVKVLDLVRARVEGRDA